eukprot:5671770-Prymnesium_polylepis.1
MLAREAAAQLPSKGMLVSFDIDCEPITPAAMVRLLQAGAQATRHWHGGPSARRQQQQQRQLPSATLSAAAAA